MQPHTLLRIGAPLDFEDELCAVWVRAQLARVPWVVVRRARSRHGLIPVGVRGATRAQRCAGWLAAAGVRELVTPLELAARGGWRDHPRCAQVPALVALGAVATIMARHGLGRAWGPAGSLGFELASGERAATPGSDVDVIVELTDPLVPGVAGSVQQELSRLAVRVDVLLEAPQGAVALTEYAQAHAPYLLRTADGPRLCADPWAPVTAAA
jgi:phosphoribosyl-dephospho-CoA transferase